MCSISFITKLRTVELFELERTWASPTHVHYLSCTLLLLMKIRQQTEIIITRRVMICYTPCIANCSSLYLWVWPSPRSVLITLVLVELHLSVWSRPLYSTNSHSVHQRALAEDWCTHKDCRGDPLCMCSSLYLRKMQDAEDVPFYT